MICLSNSSVLWGFSSSFFFLIFFWYIHSKFFVREFLSNICSQWAYSCDQSDQLPDGPHHTHGGCKNTRLAQRPVEVNNSEAAKEQPTKPRTWNIATLTPKAGLKQVHNRWWAGGDKKECYAETWGSLMDWDESISHRNILFLTEFGPS